MVEVVPTEGWHVSHDVSKPSVQANDDEDHNETVPVTFIYPLSPAVRLEALNLSTDILKDQSYKFLLLQNWWICTVEPFLMVLDCDSVFLTKL